MMQTQYKYLENAKVECAKNGGCYGVYDPTCGNKFYHCKDAPKPISSPMAGSWCVYEKGIRNVYIKIITQKLSM